MPVADLKTKNLLAKHSHKNERPEKPRLIFSPALFTTISISFGEGVQVETIDHAVLKEMSKTVKTVIRTGDFTAYGNVILVSGAGKRWFSENEN